MDFFDTIFARHSIRSYANQPVEPEKIQKILECISQAPSAGNLQGYQVYVVTKESQRIQLVNCAQGQDFLRQVPFVFVFCTDPMRSAGKYHKRGEELYSLQYATIACTYAMLAATTLGLSTVWVGAFDEDAVKNVIGIPGKLRPIILLPIGYAEESPRITPRRALAEMIHYVGNHLEKNIYEEK